MSGRVLLAARGMAFDVLAEAVDVASDRSDRAHLHSFALTDGTPLAGPGEHLEAAGNGRAS